MYVTGGIYDFFVLDSRKTQYKKYNLPILFSLDAGVKPTSMENIGSHYLSVDGYTHFPLPEKFIEGYKISPLASYSI